MKTVQIPVSLAEATTKLEGIEALLTARGWERAAIVYAFTEPGKSHFASDRTQAEGRLTITDFTKLGIAGLGHREVVSRYRAAWAEHGDPAAAPGVKVKLPEIDYPPSGYGDDALGRSRVTTGNIAKVFAEKPDLAVAAAKALAAEPEPLIAAMDSDPEVEAAVNKATWSTRSSQQHGRDMERHTKGLQAKQEDTGPTPVTPQEALTQVMWTVGPFVERLYDSLRTDEAVETASNVAAYLTRKVEQIQAWIDGALEPLDDDDFQKEINAMIEAAK